MLVMDSFKDFFFFFFMNLSDISFPHFNPKYEIPCFLGGKRTVGEQTKLPKLSLSLKQHT